MELISFFVWSTSFCIVFHRSNNWTSKIVLECMKPLSFAFTAKFPKEFPAKFHPKIVSSKVSPKNVPSKVCPPSLLETESSCFASVNWAWETLMRKCFLMTGSQGLVVTSSDWSAITLHCLWRLRVIKRSPLDNLNVLMSSHLKVARPKELTSTWWCRGSSFQVIWGRAAWVSDSDKWVVLDSVSSVWIASWRRNTCLGLASARPSCL